MKKIKYRHRQSSLYSRGLFLNKILDYTSLFVVLIIGYKCNCENYFNDVQYVIWAEVEKIFKYLPARQQCKLSLLVHLEGLEPSIIDPKKLKPIAKSSTFRIIFYHKISYQKSLNSFIYRHFNHFILSNNTIQYKHEKIQHKTAHLQKSCIFLAKICNINWQINNFMLTIIVNKSLKNNKNYTQPMMC